MVSEVRANKISPASGTAITLGDSGDIFTIPSGATIVNSGTATGFGGVGKVLQNVWYNSATTTSLTTAWGWDDTIPQIGEGTEILTQAITPVSATSSIFIQAKINFGISVGARAVGCIFTSESTNALTMVYMRSPDGTEQTFMYLHWFIPSGDTDARTYSVRVGNSGTSYSTRVNTAGNDVHYFSTAANSNMLITEYEAN